jgi:hypothetical protein
VEVAPAAGNVIPVEGLCAAEQAFDEHVIVTVAQRARLDVEVGEGGEDPFEHVGDGVVAGDLASVAEWREVIAGPQTSEVLVVAGRNTGNLDLGRVGLGGAESWSGEVPVG